MKKIIILATILLTSSCANLFPKPYVDPWVGRPVSALDTHEKHIIAKYDSSVIENDVTVRNYKFKGFGYHQPMDKQTEFTCNHLYYIQKGIIIRHAMTGRCGETI